jgi:hypothetical protein
MDFGSEPKINIASGKADAIHRRPIRHVLPRVDEICPLRRGQETLLTEKYETFFPFFYNIAL